MKGASRIREATADDAVAIADLLDQLGYPSTPDEVTARMRRLHDFQSAMVYVADVDGCAVGVITCHVFPSIHAPSPVAWLTTLVVDRAFAGKGIGKALVASAETWAESQGAARIAVTSGKHRDGAHAFYQCIGYEQTGVRLGKFLSSRNL